MKRINNYYPESMKVASDTRIHVWNLVSRRSGEAIRNQFVIRFGYHDTRFQSYETTCLVWDYETRILTVYPEAFSYSTTTSKYSRQFLEDETPLTPEEVEEVRKMAKKEDFGRDCPLYIQF